MVNGIDIQFAAINQMQSFSKDYRAAHRIKRSIDMLVLNRSLTLGHWKRIKKEDSIRIYEQKMKCKINIFLLGKNKVKCNFNQLLHLFSYRKTSDLHFVLKSLCGIYFQQGIVLWHNGPPSGNAHLALQHPRHQAMHMFQNGKFVQSLLRIKLCLTKSILHKRKYYDLTFTQTLQLTSSDQLYHPDERNVHIINSPKQNMNLFVLHWLSIGNGAEPCEEPQSKLEFIIIFEKRDNGIVKMYSLANVYDCDELRTPLDTKSAKKISKMLMFNFFLNAHHTAMADRFTHNRILPIDSSITEDGRWCALCKQLFHLIVRKKHNCQLCARAICTKCSAKYTSRILTDKNARRNLLMIRICNQCYHNEVVESGVRGQNYAQFDEQGGIDELSSSEIIGPTFGLPKGSLAQLFTMELLSPPFNQLRSDTRHLTLADSVSSIDGNPGTTHRQQNSAENSYVPHRGTTQSGYPSLNELAHGVENSEEERSSPNIINFGDQRISLEDLLWLCDTDIGNVPSNFANQFQHTSSHRPKKIICIRNKTFQRSG